MFSRTQALIGRDGLQKLNKSRVAVFGLGGVGGYVAEALARSGVGALDIFDGDTVALSNINRQIIATLKTVGRDKVQVMAERIADINPDCRVTARKMFVLPENAREIDFSVYDYVVDAIDTVAGKLAIISGAKACGVPVISCMGAGNKLNATAFEVADIEKTSVCPLARVMRRELKKRGICGVKAVFSREEPVISGMEGEKSGNKKTPASIAFVPSVAGLIAAGEVIKYLTGLNGK